MTRKILVTPVEGRLVRRLEDPRLIIKNEDGELVNDNSYYRRRIECGDLAMVKV